MKCPPEIAISDRRETELSKNGFIPLIHRKNTDQATLIGAQSLQSLPSITMPMPALSARLPYLFACSRFVHYLKCIVRDKIGAFREREDMQRWLNEWVMYYVDADPVNSSQETKAQRPLAATEVVVEDVEGNPGILPSEVLPASALPTRGSDCLAATGHEVAVDQGCGLIGQLDLASGSHKGLRLRRESTAGVRHRRKLVGISI